MKQNNIQDLPLLTQDRYENIFNVYQDENNNYYYNLLNTIVLPPNLPDSLFTSYITKPGDTLPFISYKNYDTINLWWAICIANNITNPIDPLDSGIVLRLPGVPILREIINQINYAS
jgi:LysM repeat protein